MRLPNFAFFSFFFWALCELPRWSDSEESQFVVLLLDVYAEKFSNKSMSIVAARVWGVLADNL